MSDDLVCFNIKASYVVVKSGLSRCVGNLGTFQRRPPRLLPNFKSAWFG